MTAARRRPATIADVAALAGVSRTTVSHALSGKGRVDPDTRERVQEAAGRLGYRPSPRAQRLRGGSSGAVAILSALPASIVGAGSDMGFLIEMAMPVARACLAHGYALMLVPPDASREHLDGLDIDGAIVLDPLADDPTCAALMSRGVRIVTVGSAPGVAADAVVDRGMAGVDVMLDHLVAVGARRIGVIVSEEPHALSRVLGEVARRGGRWGPSEVLPVSAAAAAGEAGGREAARALLGSHPELDAIYAPLDAFAVGAVTAARERGLTIPGDLLVATNYDGPRAATSDPPLTALDLDLPETARRAADSLMRVLAGERVGPVAVPEPMVIPRASTSVPAAPKASRR
jgi:DNA-binding LacI/PurR family transcriptional regulator